MINGTIRDAEILNILPNNARINLPFLTPLKMSGLHHCYGGSSYRFFIFARLNPFRQITV